MLTRWILENFKPFRERIDIRLAGVTVFAGLNSSGKSSILQSVLTIAQTLRHQSQDRPLVLNGSLIQLGTFDQIHNDQTSDDFLRIGFDARVKARSGGDKQGQQAVQARVTFTEAEDRSASGESNRPTSTRIALLDASFSVSKPDLDLSVTVRRLSLEEEDRLHLVADSPGPNFQATLSGHAQKGPNYAAALEELLKKSPFLSTLAHFLPYGLTSLEELVAGRRPSFTNLLKRGSRPYEELGEAVTEVMAYFGESIRYLGPLRADPAAAQGYAPSDEPDDVGSRGEYAAARYETSQRTQIPFIDPFDDQEKTDTLAVAIDRWARYLGVAHHVGASDTKVGVAWMIQSGDGTSERPLAAVGVGVSQVLPVLVGGLLAPRGSTFIMEQPELHLHARAQARLGDFFYAMSRLGRQCLLETHSDTLIRQLRYRMVREGQPARDAIAIYFIEQDQGGTSRIQPIEISPSGNILNWPDGFCDEAFLQEDRIVEASLKARAGAQP